MRTLDSFPWLKSLPPGRAIALTALATLLAAADWLPDNPVVDPDYLEFAITVVLAGSAIAIAMRDRLDTQGLRRVALRACLLTVTTVLLALAGEVSTRIIFSTVTTSADNGGFFSRRWMRANPIRANSAGFRGRPFTDAKAPGTIRVAVIGDSFTYGNGIRQQDRFSDRLQADLPAHIEVLNFGQPGANTPEHVRLVQELLPRIHPDFVLLQWYVNDVEGDDSTDRPHSLPLIPIRRWHNWLNETSALYTVANMQWAETQVALGFTASYADYLKHRLADPNSHDSVADRQLLNELITACQQAGVPIGIVLFPDTAGSMGADYPFAYLHERVLATCKARGLTCIDLRNDFSKVKERQSLWASRLDHHPSARANAIAAERILETYSKDWVAPPQR
jgi:hypothetical protein